MRKICKTQTVFQIEATECGAACLSMILDYYGKHIPMEDVRIETGVSRDGSNANNIIKAAKKFGLTGKGFKRELQGLQTMHMPCIVHWNFTHFIVLEGFSGKYVYVNDPACGRMKLSLDDFNDGFTGIVLTFEPNEDFKKENNRKSFWQLIKEHMSQKATLIKLIAIGLLLVFPNLILPMISQLFVDEVLIKQNDTWFTSLIIIFSVAAVTQAALIYYRGRVLVKLKKKTVLLSARELLYKLFSLPMTFFDQRSAGDLCGRVSNNNNIYMFISGDLTQTVLNIIVAAFYLILLIIYSWQLTLISVCAVVINLVIGKYTSDKMADYSVKSQLDSTKLYSSISAGLSVNESLKAVGAESDYVSKILGHYAKAINVEQEITKKQQIINAIPSAVSMLADVLIVLVGAFLIINNKNMTIGTLVAFTSMYGSFSGPINELVGFAKSIQTTKADIGRVEDINNYKDRSPADENVQLRNINKKVDGRVELCNVSFGYSPLSPPLVSNFNISIPCGTSVAFVGASGSGKSTISKVISGLYRPWSGEILFDNIPSQEISSEIKNASIATVSQQITLFSGTIRDNLTMWNTNITESDMIQAAKDACIHNFISQKVGGYDFKLTEKGDNVSGGERQRLEIARALATNPTILVMDEATSALDPITEKQVLNNIKRRGCTCIVVAHRLSAFRDCDQIIVMENGHIIEKGTHNSLMAASGKYVDFIKTV